jgi:hypothetical protein
MPWRKRQWEARSSRAQHSALLPVRDSALTAGGEVAYVPSPERSSPEKPSSFDQLRDFLQEVQTALTSLATLVTVAAHRRQLERGPSPGECPGTYPGRWCRSSGTMPQRCLNLERRRRDEPGPWLAHQGGCGGQGRDRTADLAVFSRTLYRLSYLPWPGGRVGAPRSGAVPTGFEPATSALTGRRAQPSCSTGP